LAQEAAKDASPDSLSIAILDLSEMPEFAPRPEPEVQRPAWRTTFGSERQTEPEVKAGTGPLALAGIDAVLIQGVQATARLRRLFPPRSWRLVVSRGILSAADPVGFRTVRRDLPRTTAIAIKTRPDLRITARTYALRLADPDSDQPPDRSEAAATAVRLVDGGGRTFWLASIALPASCGVEDPPCAALSALDAWRREKLESGEPTLIGGRMRAPADAGQPGGGKADGKETACLSHTIESDLSWQRLPPPETENPSDAGTGCISIVRLVN
jgi:hypothetical protein